MSSGQELYNRLNEKLRALVHVKNSKQVTNWIWIVTGIVQSGSCNLSKIANFLPMDTKAEARVRLVRRWLMNSNVNATGKCNRCMKEHLKGCFETKRFTWSEIQLGHGLCDLFIRDGFEI